MTACIVLLPHDIPLMLSVTQYDTMDEFQTLGCNPSPFLLHVFSPAQNVFLSRIQCTVANIMYPIQCTMCLMPQPAAGQCMMHSRWPAHSLPCGKDCHYAPQHNWALELLGQDRHTIVKECSVYFPCHVIASWLALWSPRCCMINSNTLCSSQIFSSSYCRFF